MVNKAIPKAKTNYYISFALFLAFLVLLLLTVVDIRRGFLFSDYLKVGAPSTLLNLDLLHLPLLLVSGLGLWMSYKYLARLERGLKEGGTDLSALTRVLAIAIGAILVIDLFTYRGVPASRIIVAGEMKPGPGTMGLGWAMPIATFPAWLQPAAEGINYLLVVWHATVLGLLLGGLFLAAGGTLIPRPKGTGFPSHLAGVAMALPQPFCSCCAAPIGAALYRKGFSLSSALAFTVSSPMLNITSLILASALLPVRFALLRILGGIIVGVFITYGVSLLAARWAGGTEAPASPDDRALSLSARALNAYSRLFHFELPSSVPMNSPTVLISSWLRAAGRLARVIIPLFIVSSALAVYIVQAMPASGNTAAGVTVTAAFATLLMVPTWTEIPVAGTMIGQGLPGVAAAALLTLPAVSIPCLIVIAGAFRSLRVALVLGLLVFAAGVLAGIIFL